MKNKEKSQDKTELKNEKPKTYKELFDMEPMEFVKYLYQIVPPVEIDEDVDELSEESIKQINGYLMESYKTFVYVSSIVNRATVLKRRFKRELRNIDTELKNTERELKNIEREEKKQQRKSGISEKKEEKNTADVDIKEIKEKIQKKYDEILNKELSMQQIYEDMVDKESAANDIKKILDMQHRTINKVLNIYLDGKKEKYFNDSVYKNKR